MKLILIWEIDDVIECANNMNCAVIDEKLPIRVLKYIEENYDRNYGVTWETIEAAIEHLLNEGS